MSLQLVRRLAPWWLLIAAAGAMAAEPLPPGPPGSAFHLGPPDSASNAPVDEGTPEADEALGGSFDSVLEDYDSTRVVPIADAYHSTSSDQCYEWQLLPSGLIYRTYMAGAKESRFRGVWHDDDGDGRIWDVTLGGQAPLFRYGTTGNARPEGFQVSMEGAAQTRLDRDDNLDVMATDYRFGVPITWGDSVHQVKFAFYHLSSHVADEFLLKTPGFNRLNYSRNVLVLGHSFYATERLRFYGEVGYGFDVDVGDPWELQFGFDYGPSGATGLGGAPFMAANGHLRQEVDFGGNFVGQAGWAWRRSPASAILRTGLEYYNGKSDQFSFFNDSEQKLGYGLWYDY
jgi:Protein of unknown function (DUF1207)